MGVKRRNFICSTVVSIQLVVLLIALGVFFVNTSDGAAAVHKGNAYISWTVIGTREVWFTTDGSTSSHTDLDWEIGPGDTQTITYKTAVSGTAPTLPDGDAGDIFKVEIFYENETGTAVETLIDTTTAPADGTSWNFTNTSGAGVYRIVATIEGDTLGVDDYEVSSDGTLGDEGDFHKGALRVGMDVSAISVSSYPAGSTFAFGTSGNESLTITANHTAPQATTNNEDIRINIRRNSDSTVLENGATEAAGSGSTNESFIVDDTYDNGLTSYDAEIEIIGTSALLASENWTHFDAVTSPVIKDTVAITSRSNFFNIDPSLSISSLSLGETVYNRGESSTHSFQLLNARSEPLTKTVTWSIRDSADLQVTTASDTGSTYNKTYSISTGDTSTNTTLGDQWDIITTLSDAHNISTNIFSVSDLLLLSTTNVSIDSNTSSFSDSGYSTAATVFNRGESVYNQFYLYTARGDLITTGPLSTGISGTIKNTASGTEESETFVTNGSGLVQWDYPISSGDTTVANSTGSAKSFELTKSGNTLRQGSGGAAGSGSEWYASSLLQLSTASSGTPNNGITTDESIYNRGETVTSDFYLYNIRDEIIASESGITLTVKNDAGGTEESVGSESSDGSGNVAWSYGVAAGDTALADTNGSPKTLTVTDGNSNSVITGNEWNVSSLITLDNIFTVKNTSDVTESTSFVIASDLAYAKAHAQNVRGENMANVSTSLALYDPDANLSESWASTTGADGYDTYQSLTPSAPSGDWSVQATGSDSDSNSTSTTKSETVTFLSPYTEDKEIRAVGWNQEYDQGDTATFTVQIIQRDSAGEWQATNIDSGTTPTYHIQYWDGAAWQTSVSTTNMTTEIASHTYSGTYAIPDSASEIGRLYSVAFTASISGIDLSTVEEFAVVAGSAAGDPVTVSASPSRAEADDTVRLTIRESNLNATVLTGNTSNTQIYIYDPSNSVVVNGGNPTELANGAYYYDYSLGSSPTTGIYQVVVKVTLSGNTYAGATNFEVDTALATAVLQATIDSKIDTLQTSVNTIQTDITDIGTDIDSLTSTLATVNTNVSAIQSVVNDLRASQLKRYSLELSDTGTLPQAATYRAKLTIRDYQEDPTDATTIPTITLYDPDRVTVISAASMTKLTDGVYEYTFDTTSQEAGVWETVVDVDIGASSTSTLNDYWLLGSNPPEVLVSSISDATVPWISANVVITNEGTGPQEYNYTWCVDSTSTGSCNDGDDIYTASAAKLINNGSSFIVNLPANVTATGSYVFKVVVNYGGEYSYASLPFTSIAESTTYVPDESTKIAQTFSLDSPTAISVGGAEHTVTLLSFSGDHAIVSIESDPSIVDLTDGLSQDIDTDSDSINDLRVLCEGRIHDDIELSFWLLSSSEAVVGESSGGGGRGNTVGINPDGTVPNEEVTELTLRDIGDEISVLHGIVESNWNLTWQIMQTVGTVDVNSDGFKSLLELFANSDATLTNLNNNVAELDLLARTTRTIVTQARPEPIVDVVLRRGSIIVSMLISNPFGSGTDKVTIDYELPIEVTEEDVKELPNNLTLTYDSVKDLYRVQGIIVVPEGSSQLVEVHLEESAWMIPDEILNAYLQSNQTYFSALAGSEREVAGTLLYNDTNLLLADIRDRQEGAELPEEIIAVFRSNSRSLKVVAENIRNSEKLVQELESSRSLEGYIGGAETFSTWGIILAIVFGFTAMSIMMSLTIRHHTKHIAKAVATHKKTKRKVSRRVSTPKSKKKRISKNAQVKSKRKK